MSTTKLPPQQPSLTGQMMSSNEATKSKPESCSRSSEIKSVTSAKNQSFKQPQTTRDQPFGEIEKSSNSTEDVKTNLDMKDDNPKGNNGKKNDVSQSPVKECQVGTKTGLLLYSCFE